MERVPSSSSSSRGRRRKSLLETISLDRSGKHEEAIRPPPPRELGPPGDRGDASPLAAAAPNGGPADDDEAAFDDNYTLATDEGDFYQGCPEKQRKRMRIILGRSQKGCQHCPEFVTKVRYGCGLVVTDRNFKRAILALIVINSIMMGVATFDFITENEGAARAFSYADTAFLVVFTIEVAMNTVYHSSRLFRSGWRTFDFFVVALSWVFSHLTVVRSFRCLRMITHIHSLQELVNALFNVLPRMGGVCLLLALVFYVFAVMFTELFKDYYEQGYTSENYFGRLDTTCLTLFQIMTLDSWSQITKELMEGNVWAWVPMLVFVCISSFVFINLIIAVICDAVAELHHQEIEQDVIDRLDSNKEEFKAAAAAGAPAKDILRLEGKVDDLTELVAALLRNQQRQAGKNAHDNEHDEWMRSTVRVQNRTNTS